MGQVQPAVSFGIFPAKVLEIKQGRFNRTGRFLVTQDLGCPPTTRPHGAGVGTHVSGVSLNSKVDRNLHCLQNIIASPT